MEARTSNKRVSCAQGFKFKNREAMTESPNCSECKQSQNIPTSEQCHRTETQQPKSENSTKISRKLVKFFSFLLFQMDELPPFSDSSRGAGFVELNDAFQGHVLAGNEDGLVIVYRRRRGRGGIGEWLFGIGGG